MEETRKFDLRKVLKLDWLGEEWKDCKLVFRPLGVEELKRLAQAETAIREGASDVERGAEAIDRMVEEVISHFVEGTAVSDGQVIHLKKHELAEFPSEVLQAAYRLIAGTPDPKSENPSTAS